MFAGIAKEALIVYIYCLMRCALLIILLITGFGIAAQPDTLIQYFYKNNNACPKEYAYYETQCIRENDRIRFISKLVDPDITIIKGYFTDTTLTVKHGFFELFDDAGRRQADGYYQNNVQQGVWHYYIQNTNRLLRDSIIYEKGEPVVKIGFTYHDDRSRATRLLINYKENIKEFSSWDDEKALVSYGFWINGTGDQVDYFPAGNGVKSIQHYRKGIRGNQKFFSQVGEDKEIKEALKDMEKAVAAYRKKEEEGTPSFPGDEPFQSWLASRFQVSERIREEVGLEKVTVVFMLDENGSPYDISILETANVEFREAIIDFFKTLPAWDMKGLAQYGSLRCSIALE